MTNLLAEAVLLSFMMGGMLGAFVALHLKAAKVRSEERTVELVRKRSRS